MGISVFLSRVLLSKNLFTIFNKQESACQFYRKRSVTTLTPSVYFFNQNYFNMSEIFGCIFELYQITEVVCCQSIKYFESIE